MSRAATLPDAAAWRALLGAADEASAVCVAFSGGADSSALLHHLCSLRPQFPALRVRALHVDHRLHEQSPRWAAHCRRLARELGVDLEVCVVDATAASGESPEAAARAARYTALSHRLDDGEVLATGHHADDQAETLLLQMLRGAGPHGLAAMPRLKRLASGWLARPLLDIPRAVLQHYCESHRLDWIEDPSNRDPSHDRSYLRSAVMPLLTRRWPAAVSTLSRVAAHQALAADLLDELARGDVTGSQAPAGDILPVSTLDALSPARRVNALRGWMRLRGAPVPSSAQLAEMLAEMLNARRDATPQVAWGGVVLRRHAGHLYLGTRESLPGPPSTRWPDLGEPLRLQHGTVVAETVAGDGLRADSLVAGQVEVRLRCGGERLRPHGDRHTRELKKLLYATGLPPWQRAGWPVLYVGGVLLAVPGVCVAHGHAAAPGERGYRLRWLPGEGATACSHD